MCSNYFVRNIEEDERTFTRMLSRVKEKEPCPKEITFTGGEPFLNPSIFSLIQKFRKLYPSTEINILSNGRIFNYLKYCSKLKKYFDNNMRIAISILGPTPEIHDSITLSKGSFKQTTTGIKNLLKLKIPIELRVIVLKQNYTYLLEIAQYISDNLAGVGYIVFIFVDLVYNKEKVAISYTETSPYLIKAMQLLNKNNILFRLYHFPLCTIPQEFWKNAWISVEETKIAKTNKCKNCILAKKCVGILKGYYSIFGDKEFKPQK